MMKLRPLYLAETIYLNAYIIPRKLSAIIYVVNLFYKVHFSKKRITNKKRRVNLRSKGTKSHWQSKARIENALFWILTLFFCLPSYTKVILPMTYGINNDVYDGNSTSMHANSTLMRYEKITLHLYLEMDYLMNQERDSFS